MGRELCGVCVCPPDRPLGGGVTACRLLHMLRRAPSIGVCQLRACQLPPCGGAAFHAFTAKYASEEGGGGGSGHGRAVRPRQEQP